MNKNLLNLLFIDYVNCQGFISWLMVEWMSMEHLWNNNDREEHKNSKKSLFLCLSAHHKSEGSGLGFNLKIWDEKSAISRLKYGTVLGQWICNVFLVVIPCSLVGGNDSKEHANL